MDAVPGFTRLARGVAWLSGIGASLGLLAGTLTFAPGFHAYLVSNALPPERRTVLFICAAVGAVIGGVAALKVVWNSWERLDQMSMRLGPLVMIFLLPPLFSLQAWAGRELALLAYLFLFNLVLASLAQRAASCEPLALNWTTRVTEYFTSKRWLPPVLVGVGALAFSIYFSAFTIGNHQALRTSAFDLGIEENLMWNAAHLQTPLFRTTPLGGVMTHLGFHQTWITYLIAPFYRLFPRAEFMLVLQATSVGLAAVPLYLLGKRSLGQWWGALLALLFLAYGPLHGSILYDFHYQPIGNLLILTSLYCLLERKTVASVVFITLTLLLREDMSLLLGVFAAGMLFTGQRPVAATLVGVICAIHFVGLKLMIMPRFLNGQEGYVHQYRLLVPEGSNSFGGIVKTVLGNPAFTLNTLLEREKLSYVLEILAPFALLPLRRPIGWLLVLPGFFFTLLATQYPALLSTAYQYTTYWTMFLFVGCVWALESMTPRLRRSWALPLFVGGLLCSVHFGAIVKNQQARGALDVHHFGLSPVEQLRYSQVASLAKQLPPDDSVVASERLVPHVSNRRDCYALRHGVLEATWLFTGNASAPDERPHIDRALRSGQYGIVAREGEFFIAKRGADPAQNRAYLFEMGFGP
ncbi:MAG: DUF2079 domain-containing protein [Myxococcaceae bacterium]|nr:DUF2079 domain-containing protein [Myxococcaceae bacterium]